jgi:hypothetical protein
MPFDPRDRLSRRLPGSLLRIDEDGGFSSVLARGDAPSDRPDPVPPRDARPLPGLVLRAARRLAVAGPNAPLLKRLVLHPYGLRPTGRTRTVYRPTVSVDAPVDRRAELRAALADRARVRFTSVGRSRPRAFVVRPSSWTLLPAGISEEP